MIGNVIATIMEKYFRTYRVSILAIEAALASTDIKTSGTQNFDR